MTPREVDGDSFVERVLGRWVRRQHEGVRGAMHAVNGWDGLGLGGASSVVGV